MPAAVGSILCPCEEEQIAALLLTWCFASVN